MKKTIIVLALSFISPLLLNAQDQSANSTHEFGLRSSGLNNIGVLYKIQSPKKNYWRFKAGVGQLVITNTAQDVQTNANVFFAVGYEKRRSITDKLEFIHGFEPEVGLNISNNRTTGSLGLGYVLGLQYHLNSDFLIGMEIVPVARMTLDNQANDGWSNIQVNASSAPAYLFLMHKF